MFLKFSIGFMKVYRIKFSSVVCALLQNMAKMVSISKVPLFFATEYKIPFLTMTLCGEKCIITLSSIVTLLCCLFLFCFSSPLRYNVSSSKKQFLLTQSRIELVVVLGNCLRASRTQSKSITSELHLQAPSDGPNCILRYYVT